MDRESVEHYVEDADSILKASPQMDEANTKAAVLRDLLELLGWEIPTNTQLEFPVEAFGQTYKVDYALVLEGTPVAFLEAKGADTALTTKHEDQLSSYMTNKNVTYGILTNGKQYRFFQRLVDSSNVDVQRVGDVALEDLPNRLAVLKAYQKNAIESGEAGKILGRINELRAARQTLKEEKDDLATELADVLSDRVSESILSLAESQSKEMIDRLVEDIDSEIDSDEDQPNIKNDGSTSETVVSGDHSDVDGKYIIRLQDAGNTLATFDDDNQSDVMADAVNYLIQNHALMSKIEPLPYVPGKKHSIINNKPIHTDDSEMRTFRELKSGYFLFTSLNKKDKKRHLRRLAEKCDLGIETRGNW